MYSVVVFVIFFIYLFIVDATARRSEMDINSFLSFQTSFCQ
jgi:hypothetical protein